MEDSEQNSIVVCCHSGIFHADEVMACALLKIAANDATVAVIRSRLPKDWERADYVIDVGGKFDSVKFFDHHQREGAGTRNNGLSYSSFGLIWEHIGITAIRAILGGQNLVKLTDQLIQEVYDDAQPFVMGIDAHDQGNMRVEARCNSDRSIYLEPVTVQNYISGLNPVALLESASENYSNAQFYEALTWAEDFLRRFIMRKASRILGYAYAKSHYVGGAILVLPQYCDWSPAVSELPEVRYVIYPSGNGKAYAIQAAKIEPGLNSVDNLRRPFPSEWAGADHKALPVLSGVREAVFCHRDRFMASCSTLEGALELAKVSINYGQQNVK